MISSFAEYLETCVAGEERPQTYHAVFVSLEMPENVTYQVQDVLILFPVLH